MDEDAIYNSHLEVFLLWACRETGVLETVLDGPKPADTVADSAGVSERAARIALDGLADIGHVERTDEGYVARDSLAGFDPETPVLDRGMLPHRIDSLEKYLHLPETIRTGEPPGHTEAGFHNFVGAMATIDDATVREVVTTTEHHHPRPDSVLDVGGGPGSFAAEFAARGVDVTLVDREGVLDLLSDHHEDLGVAVTPGDARESLPTGFDLVFSARMTSSFTPEDLRNYFSNAYEALEPGGTLVCAERVRGYSEMAERFAVHMLAVFENGDTHDWEAYRSALADVGFADPSIKDVPRTEYQIVTGEKPK